ncbi:MAG: hypothetical protein M3O29_02705, partial [Actinomycetota bacterium]|nr:hypothetical protein [Actinomycetota bacterium]
MSNQIATHRGWKRAVAMSLVATALISTSFSGSSGAATSPDSDPSVIRDWNATAVATIVVDAGKANS